MSHNRISQNIFIPVFLLVLMGPHASEAGEPTFPPLTVEEFTQGNLPQQGQNHPLQDPSLMQYLGIKTINTPPPTLKSYSIVRKARLTHHGISLYFYIYDSTNDNEKNYDRIAFAFNKDQMVADLKKGEWSERIPCVLTWQSDKNFIPLKSTIKINVLELEKDGFFRFRLVYNDDAP